MGGADFVQSWRGDWASAGGDSALLPAAFYAKDAGAAERAGESCVLAEVWVMRDLRGGGVFFGAGVAGKYMRGEGLGVQEFKGGKHGGAGMLQVVRFWTHGCTDKFLR